MRRLLSRRVGVLASLILLAVRACVADGVYVREEARNIHLGNDLVEFVFNLSKGGTLVSATDKRSPRLRFSSEGKTLVGEWNLEMEGSPSFGSSSTRLLRWEQAATHGECVLKMICRGPEAKLSQTYVLKRQGTCLLCRAVYENLSSREVQLKRYSYSLGNLAIGGTLTHNRFIYPPQIFHFMHGRLEDATPDYMGKRYIYGSLQQTTKLMLPYAMIYNDAVEECVTIAGVNSRTVVRVGAVGGASGSLTSVFDIFKLIAPGKKENLGTVYLAFLPGDWRKGMQAERRFLMEEAEYKAPKTMPGFMKGLVIMADGIPGVNISTFDDLGNTLGRYRDAGITAVWIGGKLWFCPYSTKPESAEGFIPIPQNGYVVPDSSSGGEAGLKRLIARAHSLGMKLFVWGPTSMAGVARQSRESETEPDWWVHDKEGRFSNWYPFMAPANPNSPGWRAFFLNNVRKIVRDYGVDGFWLDSSWQDHQLNYKAREGWYGEPNGAKLSLISDIVAEAKRINPDCVVMAEGGGIETMSRVDAAYVQAFGIWPTIRPEEVQLFVESQELNRIPGIRPFGQICRGLGFYAEMSGEPHELAEACKDSWIAKTFLVSTLDRVPVYFGLNWDIGALWNAENAKPSSRGKDGTEQPGTAEAQEPSRIWFEAFKRVNKIRTEYPEVKEGETLFDCVEVSSASVVHYVRRLASRISVILLNADKDPQTIKVRITKPEVMNIKRRQRYEITNLMTEGVVEPENGATDWGGWEIMDDGIVVRLKGYEGAILKVRPAARR